MRTERLRPVLLAALASLLITPVPAAARQDDGWRVDFAPLYLWASSIGGEVTAGPAEVPVKLDFGDAVDHLGGFFSFHLEAAKGRWGVLTDVSFFSLTTGSEFTVGGVTTVSGDVELDNILFEAAGSYLLAPKARFAVIGGLRTYTMSPRVSFDTPVGVTTPIDASQTSANGFVGVTYRPRLASRLWLISRADAGAGNADFTWSALVALEYRFKPWGGLDVGYKGLGIDVTGGNNELRSYDVTHHGPIFGLNLHWGG
jgi:hypothetical protein